MKLCIVTLSWSMFMLYTLLDLKELPLGTGLRGFSADSSMAWPHEVKKLGFHPPMAVEALAFRFANQLVGAIHWPVCVTNLPVIGHDFGAVVPVSGHPWAVATDCGLLLGNSFSYKKISTLSFDSSSSMTFLLSWLVKSSKLCWLTVCLRLLMDPPLAERLSLLIDNDLPMDLHLRMSLRTSSIQERKKSSRSVLSYLNLTLSLFNFTCDFFNNSIWFFWCFMVSLYIFSRFFNSSFSCINSSILSGE